jgi:very-short-patch-repair endonuclease
MECPHEKALPLEGGGLGGGVRPECPEERDLAQAPTLEHPERSVRTPPTPALPPLRGKGAFERASYTPRAASQAKRLRRELTASERKLWEALRALKLNIRRQAPIGRYIVDFTYLGTKTILEVDSARHDLPEAQLHDAERDSWLTSEGYRVLRIRGQIAFGRPHDVARRFAAVIADRRR